MSVHHRRIGVERGQHDQERIERRPPLSVPTTMIALAGSALRVAQPVEIVESDVRPALGPQRRDCSRRLRSRN
jgi:hypothetical protein